MGGKKLFLLRYDTERRSQDEMHGFLEKLVSVHRRYEIPVTLFCTGGAIESREQEFRHFYEKVKNDPLFDIQDHSYSHIGIGYTSGPSVEALRADYEQSLVVHERIFGVRPIGISICGTSGRDGPRLRGFDETVKSRAEFEMLTELGVRMINAHLVGIDESKAFTDYAALGHPEVMGFPSAYSDTSWMYRKERGDPLQYILDEITKRAELDEHMPLMLHDWVAWRHAPDQELTHVRDIVDHARGQGYELVTHVACYKRKGIWQKADAQGTH